MIIATLSSLQYGVMIDLEYYGIIVSPGFAGSIESINYEWGFVLYKIITTMVACFAVAFLSSLLAEQEKKAQNELNAMGSHVKRVEKLAAVGEMAAGMAHEIRNPLASLSGSIQLLREDIDNNPEQEKLMDIILREADRLSSLISNFLLFAKPHQGKAEFLQLDKVLDEIIELFKRDNTSSKTILIEKEYEPGLLIKIDSGHLRQIIWNLFLNAAEAIENQGNIKITTCLSKDKQVCIIVSDNGCGIPYEVIDSIFDPFFTTKPKGTGLGLSIIHRILEAYNCQLDVTSQPGQGTTFTLKVKSVA